MKTKYCPILCCTFWTGFVLASPVCGPCQFLSIDDLVLATYVRQAEGRGGFEGGDRKVIHGSFSDHYTSNYVSIHQFIFRTNDPTLSVTCKYIAKK